MKIVIDIYEKDYQLIKKGKIPFSVVEVLREGIPLPEYFNKIKDDIGRYELDCRFADYSQTDACTICNKNVFESIYRIIDNRLAEVRRDKMREIVIKISDELYEYIVKGKDLREDDEMALAIADGKPLPEHHGDLIDRDNIEVLRLGNLTRQYDKGFDAGVTCMVNRILETPTIIEGSESE